MLIVPILLVGLQLCAAAKLGVSFSEFSSLPKDFLLFGDSSNIVYHDHGSEDHLFISHDSGAKFEPFPNELAAEVLFVQQNPYYDSMAYVFTNSKEHWMTGVGGSQWKKFTTPEVPVVGEFPSPEESSGPLVFHKKHPEKMLFAGACVDGSAHKVCERTYYVSTGLGEPFRPMTQAHSCVFATNAVEMSAEMTVFCAAKTPDARDGLALVRSADFFETDPVHVFKDGGILTGMELLGTSNDYILAIGGHFLEKKSRFAYISYDGTNWDKITIPGDKSADVMILDGSGASVLLALVEEESATLYGSSKRKAQISLTPKLANIQYANGVVDYEQIEALAGVVFANVKDGKVHTEFSLNNGASWERPVLKDCKDQDGCFVNLHLQVQRASTENSLYEGNVLSTKIPGLLVGVGNTGESLKEYKDCDTFVSLDAGLTWAKALDGPYLFEVGDAGTAIVAVGAVGEQEVVKYSLDFGQSWEELKLGRKVVPKLLTGAGGSTTLSFVLVALDGDKALTAFFDLKSVYKHKCKNKDFEEWALKTPSGDEVCTMGHKWRYMRRKLAASCYVGSWFLEPELLMESCPCERHDYECAEGFSEAESGDCAPDSSYLVPLEECREGGKYMGPSGYTLIHGSKCSVEGGLQLAKTVERDCEADSMVSGGTDDEKEGERQDAEKGHDDSKVTTSMFDFKGSVTQYSYLTRNGHPKDETLVVLTDRNEAFVTHDQGSTWEQVAPGEEFLAIFPNPYYPNYVFLVATKDKVVYSVDRGETWKSFRAPAKVTPDLTPLSFDRVKPDNLIFIGEEGCETMFSEACHSVSYSTETLGRRWKKVEEDVNSCEFLNKDALEGIIVCEKKAKTDAIGVDVVMIGDNLPTKTLLSNTVGFAQVDGYFVSALQEGDSLRLVVSTDLNNWQDAVFPHKFHHLQSFTTLSGAQQAMFIYVTTNTGQPNKGVEYGSLYKSNSDGRFFALSLANVNRDSAGYVDFERMPGLEGIIVVNTISNTDSVKQGSRKALRTMITHNDGGQWDLLSPPAKNVDGKELCKGKSLEQCSLHLHGFTERIDTRDTYSSESAVGMMIGVGNVGDKLESYHDGNTYLTYDGGITWKEVKKGAYMWEYGDMGSVIVLVNAKDATDTLSYSVDLGETWTDYQFADEKVVVQDISTVPSDTSLKFILYTRPGSDHGDRTRIYQISFEKLLAEPCSNNMESDDYEKWTPRHPHQEDDCLFGRKLTYYRKAPGKLCHTGALGSTTPVMSEECQCSAVDYECDTNYIRADDGKCILVEGLSVPDHRSECSLDGRTEYTPATGYRKIPISSCEGGLLLDKPPAIACPNQGVSRDISGSFFSAFVTFMFIVLVIGSVCYGTFVFTHYRKKLGVIRLDDDNNYDFEDHTVFERANTAIAAAVISGIAYLSHLVNRGHASVRDLWKRRSGFESFRGTGSGAYVVGDDDDLFGASFRDDAAEILDDLDYSDDGAGDLANFRR